jgi:hypothetical protein
MNPSSSNHGAANQGNKDYLDKAVEGAQKKFGGAWGQNTEKNRGMNEKIVRSTLILPFSLSYLSSLVLHQYIS